MRYYIDNTQVKDIDIQDKKKKPTKDTSGIAKLVIVIQQF